MNKLTKSLGGQYSIPSSSRARIIRWILGIVIVFSWIFSIRVFYNSQRHFEVMQKGDMLFFLVLTTEAEFKESYLKSYYYGKPFPAVEVHRVLRDPADFNAARAEVFDRHKKLSAIIKQRGLEDRVEWIEKKNRDTGKVANDSLPTPEQTKP